MRHRRLGEIGCELSQSEVRVIVARDGREEDSTDEERLSLARLQKHAERNAQWSRIWELCFLHTGEKRLGSVDQRWRAGRRSTFLFERYEALVPHLHPCELVT